ncbi:hypothetical protein [Bacillus sp. AFS031507]
MVVADGTTGFLGGFRNPHLNKWGFFDAYFVKSFLILCILS